ICGHVWRDKMPDEEQAPEVAASETLTIKRAVKPAKRSAKKKGRRKKPVAKKRLNAKGGDKARTSRPFPASTFEEALEIADGIQKYAAGQRIRRLTLFDKLGKSPESGPSRQLITNSAKYGLTTGSYKAEYIELTSDGRVASSPDANPQDRLSARFKLAIGQIPA